MEFIHHVESSNVAKLPHSKAKISALQLVLEQVSRKHSFPTVICKALHIATHAGNSANAGLTFTSLAQYLTSDNTASTTSKSNLGIIVLCTAICSGWSSVSTDSLVLDLAHRILISSLQEEFDNHGVCCFKPALKDSILFILSTSEVRRTSLKYGNDIERVKIVCNFNLSDCFLDSLGSSSGRQYCP